MSLTVKAYVLPSRTKKDDFEEIRRFTINKSDANIFTKLFEKVCEVFPSLDKDKTSLHWKDNDGDLIHFTTNKELAEGLKSMVEGVFKLYAKETPLFKDSTEVHVGVVCSNCKKPVEGSRYKCLACPDYDLCHSCELIGTHLEHTMIKIPTPSTPWVAQIMQYSYTYGPMSPMSPIPSMMLKCRSDDRGARSLGDQSSSPIIGRPSFASSIGQPYQQNDWSLFNDAPLFSRADMGESNGMQRSFHAEETQQQQQRRQNRTADSIDSMEMVGGGGGKSQYSERLFDYNGSPPDNTSGDWTILNSKSKESNEVTSTSSTRTELSGAKLQSESTRMSEISLEKETSSKRIASASATASASSSLFMDDQERSIWGCDPLPAASAVAFKAESTAIESHETKKEVPVAAAATNGAVMDADIDSGAATTTTPPPSEDGGASPRIDTDVSSTTQESTEGEDEKATTDEFGNPKPKVDNNVYIPSIRRYAEALDNLMSMGFTNEGGWLTVLVEEKRGDIIRVLDFIENNIQKCKENEQAKSRG